MHIEESWSATRVVVLVKRTPKFSSLEEEEEAAGGPGEQAAETSSPMR